jgi:hypothetical protein
MLAPGLPAADSEGRSREPHRLLELHEWLLLRVRQGDSERERLGGEALHATRPLQAAQLAGDLTDTATMAATLLRKLSCAKSPKSVIAQPMSFLMTGADFSCNILAQQQKKWWMNIDLKASEIVCDEI